MNTPKKNLRPPVHRKVKAAAVGGGAAGVVTTFVDWCLSSAFWHGGAVPIPVTGMVGLVAGVGVTFAAGYLTVSTGGVDDVAPGQD